MNAEQITKFLTNSDPADDQYVKIAFKTRSPVYGLFLIDAPDHKELSAKNFWRVVTKKNADNYKKSSSLQYSRLFNGSEFTKLSLLKDGSEE